MKWFQDIFTKSKLMLVSGILSLLCWAILLVNALFVSTPGSYYAYALLTAMMLMLLICCRKGETSAQKALGASLITVALVVYWQQVSGVTGYGDGGLLMFLDIFMTVITAIIFLNHIILQTDHKGDLTLITVNEVVLLLALAVQIPEFVIKLFNGSFYYDCIHSLGFLFTYIFITCMEARIQKYKARRFEGMRSGTWTEEERQKSKKIFRF